MPLKERLQGGGGHCEFDVRGDYRKLSGMAGRRPGGATTSVLGFEAGHLFRDQ